MSRSNMGRRSCQPGPVCLLDGGLGRNKPHLGNQMGVCQHLERFGECTVLPLRELRRVHCAALKRFVECTLLPLGKLWRVHCAASKRGLESALCCH